MQTSKSDKSELHARILQTATELFPQYGIRGVSMDEIAQGAGISKRTLYENFADKEELLVACIEENHREVRRRAEEISGRASTVLHVILEMYNDLMPRTKNYSARFRQDMLRYPKVVTLLKKHRNEHLGEIKTFFALGVEQGMFLPEVNYDIISRMILRLHEAPIPSEIVERYTSGEILSTLILTFLRGVCSRKGQQIFEDYQAEYRSH